MQINNVKKSNILDNIRSRIIYIADNKEVSRSVFLKKTNLKKGIFDYKDINRAVGSDKISKILEVYQDINPSWLLTGKGKMILKEDKNLIKDIDNPNIVKLDTSEKIPYYDLPVSAGQADVLINGNSPDGYIQIKDIPGMPQADAVLPVYGYSMQPEVNEGALIGVRKLEQVDYLNTRYKYLIVTKDDRMIKYIAHDKEDDSILWCKSPNYGDFKILKEDILEIHRVTWVLNPG